MDNQYGNNINQDMNNAPPITEAEQARETDNTVHWEKIDVEPHNNATGTPMARVTSSSITFNAAAVALIENIEQYPWAVVRVGMVNGKPAMLGFQFVAEQQEGAFAVKKQSKNHKGVTFFSRDLVKKYFRLTGIGIGILLQEVEQLDAVTLTVKLPTEENMKKDYGFDKLEEDLEKSIEKSRELIEEGIDLGRDILEESIEKLNNLF